jgi:hypothetical protein
MSSRNRRFTIRRADYIDAEDFAEALWFNGGPEHGQVIGRLPGPYGDLLWATYGSGEIEEPDSADHEQQAKPDRFVKKVVSRSRKRKP